VIGVSSDPVETHDRWADRECLPFPLLSDSDGRVRNAYGVPRSLFGLLPGRVTFVIGKDRVIRQVFSSQFRLKRHVERAREAILELVGKGAPRSPARKS